ncbi:hypothetical protein RYX36_003603 [Vicia faba]
MCVVCEQIFFYRFADEADSEVQVRDEYMQRDLAADFRWLQWVKFEACWVEGLSECFRIICASFVGDFRVLSIGFEGWFEQSFLVELIV